MSLNHDLHVHTNYSDGASAIATQILYARTFELDAIAITDHYVPGFKLYDSQEQFDRYLAEIRRERSGHNDVVVLAGAEATALDTSGRITIDQRHAEQLEWVLCDLGGKSEGTLLNGPATKRQFTENVLRTYLALCDVKYLDVIAHPLLAGETQPPATPLEYPMTMLRELAAKMAATGKVFDVMNEMVYWFRRAVTTPREFTEQYVEVVRLFASAGVKFQVSSDDHYTGLGNTRWSQRVVKLSGVPAEQIVDARKIVGRR